MLELLEQGADPNSRRATGTTPLFFAAQGGYLDVVKILIKAGASVDTPSVVIKEKNYENYIFYF